MSRKLPDWLRLKDVPAFYYHQTGDKLPSIATVRHWMKHGKRDYTTEMVRLKHIVRKGLWMTRKAWVDEFINRVGVILDETI